jgi:hypothetical protein
MNATKYFVTPQIEDGIKDLPDSRHRKPGARMPVMRNLRRTAHLRQSVNDAGDPYR